MDEHREIYRAIRAKKPAEARAAMERPMITSQSDQNTLRFAPKANRALFLKQAEVAQTWIHSRLIHHRPESIRGAIL